MKYKILTDCNISKGNGTSLFHNKGEIIETDDYGRFVFIPFDDTRFFEPVKTHKFEIEVSEDQIDHFRWLNEKGKAYVNKKITQLKKNWCKQKTHAEILESKVLFAQAYSLLRSKNEL